MPRPPGLAAWAACFLALFASIAHADQGPASPMPPEVVSRDAMGHVTIRAVRLTEPIGLDGRLDEPIYARIPAVSDYIQQDPVADAPATEKTETWLFYDNDTFYVMFRCWDSQPDAIVANEMRRDSSNILQNDHVAFVIDTFHDRRNALEFAVNPIGGRWDGEISNERQPNSDWNPIWEVAIGHFEHGWTIEAAIPFKSLRYRSGHSQVWGFNVRRRNSAKNEVTYLTRVPRALGPRGLLQVSLAATVVGIEAPEESRNIELKPYVVSNLTSHKTAGTRAANDLAADFGADFKYGLTPSMTADITYNTDFAQVEADEQQLNLTRFSLFFPEKREFFLENRDLFAFGGTDAGPGDTPVLFHSRRIGFDQDRPAPIDAGGRVTGRIGAVSLGLLNVESGETPTAPRTNFSVARVKRNILRRSAIGAIFTARSTIEGGTARNEAYGVDGTFAFFENLAVNSYWAKTQTAGEAGADTSYRAQLDYAGDRYGLMVERLVVGDTFHPGIGFLRRDDIRRWQGQARFSPRPRHNPVIRKFTWAARFAYTENGAGRLDTRAWNGDFAIDFQNSDRFNASYTDTYEFLPAPTSIVGITIPIGGYDYATTKVGYTFGQQRPASGAISVEHGAFYHGTRTTVTISQGRLNVTPQLSIAPTYAGNWASLPEGRSATHLTGSRITYTVTPAMFVSALLQYNSAGKAVSANVRLRWEYRPGSELFLVFTEQRDPLSAGSPSVSNRTLALKINRLLRF